MPETTAVDLDQYQKDKDEFAEALDEIFQADEKASDEDINKKIDQKLGTDKAEGATRDQAAEAQEDPIEDNSNVSEGLGQITDEDPKPATESKPTPSGDWQTRALEAENKVKDLEAQLAKEIQKTKSWDGRIAAANKRTKELEAELELIKQERPTEEELSDRQKIAKFRDDFPEMGEVLDILQKKITPNRPAKADPEPASDTTPGNTTDTKPEPNKAKEPTDHYKAVVDVHKDLEEILASGVLLTWIRSQKPYIRPHLEKTYENGNSDEVITMLSEFKAATGWKSRLDDGSKAKMEKKLAEQTVVDSESSGAPKGEPDKYDYDQGAKDAGL